MSTSKRVLVIGGGIAGITAAIEASETGVEVLLVEKNPYLGGRVTQMNLYFPKLCPPDCGLEINLRRFRASSKIRYLTQSRVTAVSGEPGAYQVSIQREPRFVSESCTACGACTEVCPVERPDQFNFGVGKTKAVYLPFPTAFPMRFLIDPIDCLGSECLECKSVCPVDCIDLKMASQTMEEEFASIIVATGWAPYAAEKMANLGFGTHEDVISNMMMERLASPTGPTRGKIVKPSNGEPVKSVAFVQCAGSRDENHLKHCSSVCCLASLKQARYVREQYPDAKIYIFYIDIRSPGRLEDFYAESQKDEDLILIKGKVGNVLNGDSQGSLTVEAENVLSGRRIHKDVDLVVLATGIVPQVPSLNGGLSGDEHGFVVMQDDSGIIPTGCVRRPAGVAESVRDATSAALKAVQVAKG